MTSYPTPAYRRTALAPAILGAIALLAGIALIDGDGFTIILFAVSILALIVAWFAWQAKQWWWIAVFVPIALLWNPVFPIDLGHNTFLFAHYIAAIVFIAAGVLIRVRNPDDRNAR